MAVSNILGLDIGDTRIGVARANTVAKLPEPLCTLLNDNSFINKLNDLVKEHSIDLLVVGLPRNMSGKETAQTAKVKQFVKHKLNSYSVVFQDETLTSVVADQRLGQKRVSKDKIDAEAACIILEDYLNEVC